MTALKSIETEPEAEEQRTIHIGAGLPVDAEEMVIRREYGVCILDTQIYHFNVLAYLSNTVNCIIN